MTAAFVCAAMCLAAAWPPVPSRPGPEAREFVRELSAPSCEPRLDFTAGGARRPWLELRFSRCFFSPVNRKPFFRDELMDDVDYYPDAYLERLEAEGVNALWIVVRLRHLANTRFAPPDQGMSRRVAKLRRIVAKCAPRGIKVWLFGIEPHRIQDKDDPLYREHPDVFSSIPWPEPVMCPSSPETLRYLEESFRDVFAKVPGLGGYMNISHGERKTTCLSFVDPVEPRPLACPKCATKRPWQLHAATTEAMLRGMRASSPDARLVSWLYHPESAVARAPWVAELAEHVPDGVTLQYNFESGVEETFRGRRVVAGDYWHSRTGPAAPFAAVAAAARTAGAKLSAKIQVACGYEMADLPIVPVPGILYRKYKAMRELGVSSVMQSWYPGCYPGIMGEAAGALAYEDFKDGEDAFLMRLARPKWGADAEEMVRLWKTFESAYVLYPLSLYMQYYGPFNAGVAWPLHVLPDLKPLARTWRADDPPSGDSIGEALEAYSLDEARGIANKMCERVEPCLAVLDRFEEKCSGNRERLLDIGLFRAVHALFESARDVFDFYALRRDAMRASRHGAKDFEGALSAVRGMRAAIARAEATTRRIIPVCERDSRIGFHSEAECHLFHPALLRWRLETLKISASELDAMEVALARGEPYPESEGEKSAPVWLLHRNAVGDFIVAGDAVAGGHAVSVYTVDEAGTTFAKAWPASLRDGKFEAVVPAAEAPFRLFVRQGGKIWPEGPMPGGRLLLRRLQYDRFGKTKEDSK